MGSIDGQLGKTGSAFKKVGGLIAGAFAGQAVVSGVKTMISSASDLNETISKTETIFGKSSADILKWSDNAAKSMGLSKQAALDGVSTFGNFFDQIGIGSEETKKMSKGFVQAAVDLGSFHNAAAPDVMEALAAATRGEYDSLQKYVPTINAATVEQEALRATGKKLAAELTNQDKARAVSALVMKGQGKAAGDFARTQDSLANQTKIAKAQFDNMVATLGTKLLPVATTVVGYIVSDVLPKLQQLGNFISEQVVPALKDFGKFLLENKDTLIALGAGMTAAYVALGVYNTIVKVTTAVTAAWNVVQKVLNGTMKANPIGLVVTAIGLLVAGLVLAYQKSDTFRAIVDKAFAAVRTVMLSVVNWITQNVPKAFGKITDAAQGVYNWVKSNWKLLLGIITGPIGAAVIAVVTHWDDIKAKTKAAFDTVKNTITGAWNAVKDKTQEIWSAVVTAVGNKVADVIQKVKSIKDKVTGAFSGAASWLTQAGKDVISGLVAGLEAAKQWVIDKIQEIADHIPGWVKKRLGIASPSKVMKALGNFVSQGLALGIEEGGGAVTTVMDNISTRISAFYEDKYPKAKKKAVAATKEFLKGISDEGTALRQNLAAQQANNVALQNAMTVLDAAKQKMTDYAAAVTAATVAYGGLIGLGQRVDEEGVVTITSDTIIADLQKKVTQANEFATLIGELTAQGLNKTNLDQLIAAGVDGGLATAQALAAGGPQAIAQINSMSAQLQAVATSLGTSTSQTMHGAGVLAAEGLVTGFESMADKLEAAGDRLAKKLLRAIKRALKTASPSRATKEIGKYVGQGLVLGMGSTAGAVQNAGRELAKNVEKGFSAPQLELNANGGKNGGNTYEITIKADPLTDTTALGKKLLAVINQAEGNGARRLAIN